jgi:phosphohistidine swiveling domain-containing protein
MDGETLPPFEPPRPGFWLLDPMHFTRPVTRFVAEVFPPAFWRGFSESLLRYGALLECLDYVFVNGFPYYCPRPVGAPLDAVGAPSRPVWDDLIGSHPEIRARLAASEVTFACRRWREDLDVWEQKTKPAVIRAQLGLQAVDPERLDAEALKVHLEHCRANVEHQLYVHHLHNVPAMLPVGDFLAHAHEWTGRSVPELLALFRGATPASRGGAAELRRVAEALTRDSAGRDELFGRGKPAEVLRALTTRSGDVGAAVMAYLDLVGHRLVNGEDIGEPYALEMPQMLVQAIRSAVEQAGNASGADEVDTLADVRAATPTRHREAFDTLFAEARATYRLRDERGLFCDLWAHGLMRRAGLAAGRRLAERGRIAEPEYFLEAGYGEMQALLGGDDDPSGDELERRARYRTQTSLAQAPRTLGGPPGEPLPLEWLPAPAARLERALRVYLDAMLVPAVATEPRTVRGIPASAGVYEGPARFVDATSDFARIRPGDVLVAASMSAAFNVVLPMLGAIVTDHGGALSHAAIVARECGIPGVVGCRDATQRIPDGARVRVDGRAGEVAVLT